MKNNKSIDGLTTRAVKKPAPKKIVKKEDIKPAKKAVKVTSKETTPTTKVVAEKKVSKKTESQTVDDFLKPVQAFDFDSESGELKESKMTKKELKAERKANKKLAKEEKRAGKKSHKVRNIIASIFLVLVLGVCGVIIWAVVWGNDIIAKITGGQGNVFDIFTFMDDNYEPLKVGANGRTNILAFGTSGYDMSGDEGNGVHDGAQLTDSIMVISVNQDTGDVAMLSLPRDLKASPTCTATGKINEVYWCNGGSGTASLEEEARGATALMNEVGGILGIDFQYYAHVNWGSILEIVDTLGGINVTLNDDVYDYCTYKAGIEYTINGDQALCISRARHGTARGDFSRSENQQRILIGIKNKLMEKNLSITDYLSLASALGDNLRSNFTVENFKTLAHMSYIFDLESMRQVSLYDPSNGIYYMTTANINGISYVIPSAGVGNYGAIRNVVATKFSSDPRVYEAPTIAILNATGTDGVAAEQKTKLEAEGFTIAAIDNIEGEFEEEYSLYDFSVRTPGTTKMLEDYYGIINATTSENIPANIPRGYDLVIVIGPSPSKTEEQ